MTRIKNAWLVLIGRYNAYDPITQKVYSTMTHFISRYSNKPRVKKVQT
jgi:hypothetical protein